MPIDFEVVLSASPPVFTHSALSDFRYPPFPNNRQHSKYTFDAISYINGINTNLTNTALKSNGPIRPCLIVKGDSSTIGDSNDNRGKEMVLDDQTHRNGKKRVWFADDKGLALTHVRFMAEPSDCPPQWSDEFLEHVTCGVLAAHMNGAECWEPTFPQPASDYLEFRNKVERNNVSLENVIVKKDEATITGTVKVKNTCFEKDVFVRVTFDRWLTHEDVRCTFSPSGVDGGGSLFDTFTFSIAIPPTAIKFQVIEFCVCYKANGEEFWDNNGGYNYKLVPFNKKKDPLPSMNRFVDAVTAHLDTWTEFASWQHLITDGPYW